MTVFNHIRLLPLLILVSLLSFVVRVGHIVSGFGDGQAFAQQEVDAEAPPLPSAAAPEKDAPENTAASMEGKAGGAASPAPPASPAAGMPASAAPGVKAGAWQDATDTELEFSDVQAELYNDLAKRRAELEKREKELATREALLEAGRRELDQKLQEMTVIRNQIEAMLEEQSEQEKARIQSLVKIYEGMKAKDAAAVFNTLDIDILVRLLQSMSERKTAPILAYMNPARVQEVTTLLAQQKQIPVIPGN